MTNSTHRRDRALLGVLSSAIDLFDARLMEPDISREKGKQLAPSRAALWKSFSLLRSIVDTDTLYGRGEDAD